MKPFPLFLLTLVIMVVPIAAFAGSIDRLIHLLTEIDNKTKLMQLDIEALSKNILAGTSQWGHWNFTDYQSWGHGAETWKSVLNVAQNGGNDSLLGQEITQLANEFPINTPLVNAVNPNKSNQKYYALQAETALAARAASQLGYNKVQEQIDYANRLRNQIDTTTTIKQSVDLQNRIMLENNLIQLEMLRQISLINQQQSIQTQGEVNDVTENAKFLRPNNF